MGAEVDWSSVQTLHQRVSAVEQVFRTLRDAITSGGFPVGSKLEPETSLAARFGVSRSVVREALRSCNVLGLTETRTGRGTFVVTDVPATTETVVFGGYSAGELLEARPFVEVPTAELAAERRSPEDLRLLTSLMERMLAVADTRRWVAMDDELHAAIARASGNRVFGTVLGDLRRATRDQSVILALAAGRREDSDREHQEIVDAIADGSPARAGRAMAEHIRRVEQVFTTLLAGSAVGSTRSP